MRKDIIPMEAKKPFEVVQELKSGYEIPSFEEFMKTYESDDKIINSYEDEFKAQVVQGSQYGPGKSNFTEICRNARQKFQSYGKSITGRISCDSDYFYSWKEYAGAIIYSINGNYKWENSGGEADGRTGWCFYVIIKCTNDWPDEDKTDTGNGVVHRSLIRRGLGFDINNTTAVCGGGFAWRYGGKRYGSWSLNERNVIGGTSDGDRQLSPDEIKLVDYCWEEYEKHGPSHTFDIPYGKLPSDIW